MSYEKVLTNKFTGTMAQATDRVTKAIMNKFAFSITNNSENNQRVALIPSYLPCMGVTVGGVGAEDDFVTAVDFTGETVTTAKGIISFIPSTTVHYHDTTALNAAGYPVDAILDDATVTTDDNKTLVMQATNPTKKIQDFLQYIKTNPTMLKSMTIISDEKSAFTSDQEVAKLNPFTREKEVLIDNNMFYDRYQMQSDRVNIEFDNELELSDVLLWVMTIPAGAKMDIILRF